MNIFSSKTDKELLALYEQFVEWNETGVLGDNELGKIRDQYCAKYTNSLLLVQIDLLKEISKRWYNVARC